MAGQKFQYDESGGTFFYFLLSFLALILIPTTLYYWPRKKKEGSFMIFILTNFNCCLQQKSSAFQHGSHRTHTHTPEHLLFGQICLTYAKWELRMAYILVHMQLKRAPPEYPNRKPITIISRILCVCVFQ